MKRTLFMMVIAGAIAISILDSCSKDDSLPIQSTGTGTGSPGNPNTIALTTNHWESKGNGIFVNVFSNILPVANANQSLGIYVVTNGKDVPIDQPISFMNGQLWATHTVTDVIINFRGNLPPSPYLNIKIVMQ
jgi:hypothetical protein